MQRRIGLAQALINDPDLVILDEPTAGLDPIGCREVKDLIVALARRGKTVILSSHLLSDVEDVCDRVVIYYGGKIQAAGTLKELLAEPDTLRITTPVLPRETLERVLEIIRKDVSTGEVRVDNPTQNLESYFLDVVAKGARGERNQRRAIRRARGRVFARRRGSKAGRRKKFWKNCRCRRRRNDCRSQNFPRQLPRRKWTTKNWKRWRRPARRHRRRNQTNSGSKAGGFVQGG